MENRKLTLVHYKQAILDKLKTEKRDPTNRKIIEWTDTHIRPNKLINVMKKEGLIKIEMVQDGKTVRRMLTPLTDKIIPDEEDR